MANTNIATLPSLNTTPINTDAYIIETATGTHKVASGLTGAWTSSTMGEYEADPSSTLPILSLNVKAGDTIKLKLLANEFSDTDMANVLVSQGAGAINFWYLTVYGVYHDDTIVWENNSLANIQALVGDYVWEFAEDSTITVSIENISPTLTAYAEMYITVTRTPTLAVAV